MIRIRINQNTTEPIHEDQYNNADTFSVLDGDLYVKCGDEIIAVYTRHTWVRATKEDTP